MSPGDAVSPDERSAVELLERLSSLGVGVRVDGGQLRLRAPKGVLDDELRATLARRKPELLRLLSSGSGEDAPIVPVPRDEPPPVSSTQERFLFLARMIPGSVAYNLPNVHRLDGPLDPTALERAVHVVVSRHEALRTRFADTPSGPVQQIDPEPRHDFTVVDVATLSGTATEPAAPASLDTEPEVAALRLAEAEAARPFDMFAEPLLRVVLYRCSATRHLLSWTVHHAISDGWSSMIFLRELRAAYESLPSDEPTALPPVSLHYVDFGAWERERLASGAFEAELAYWRERLAVPPEPLSLPIDKPRPAVLSYRGSAIDFELPERMSEAIRALARTLGVTPFTVLLTAWKILLHRYSGQTDICVGSPIARRDRPELETVYGCVINALALRSDLSGDPTVAELVRAVRTNCVEAFAHQQVPFERVVEAVDPERDTSVTPLFQTMFIFHVQDARKVDALGPVSMERLELHAPGSKYDLTLELTEREGGSTRGFVEYATDLFERETVERLIGHLRTLLGSLVRAPGARLSELELLDAEERERVLEEWNATTMAYPREATVVDLFDAQAARTPEAVAVRGPDGRTWTYAMLRHASARVAARLDMLGVSPGERVGLYLERGVELAAALLGLMRSGAAYVPLDPLFPPERLALMVEDASLRRVLTQESLAATVPGEDVEQVVLDEADLLEELSSGEGDATPEAVPTTRATAEGVAYVIYTSGSTGRPKGVAVGHRALVNFLCAMRERPGLGAADRLLAVTTLSFDIAGLELYLPWTVGAEVHLASREETMDPERLAARLERGAITVMQGTPATWRMLLDGGRARALAGLKALCGGERLERELAEGLFGALGEKGELWNLYGPTETTIWSTAERVARGEGVVPVGRPIGNTRVYVLGERGEVQPVGAVGELCIGGAGVAEGYLGREELTVERFVTDPFAAESGARMYRTGDRARWRADGRLEVLGRLDEQVKLRGYRLEPGEVRACLLEEASVRDAVVVVQGTGAEARLVAYVVGADEAQGTGGTLDVGTLRSRLKRTLPEYMVPTAWVALDELPLTPNGKVNRKGLPAPAGEEGVLAGSADREKGRVIEPRGETERAVARVWGKLLGVEPENVDVERSFFEQGGHSLLAVRLSTGLRRELGVEIELLELFQGATVADIAATMNQGHEGGSTDDGSSKVEREDPSFRLLTRPNAVLTPLFMVGSNPAYRAAVDLAFPERPVYQLDAYALQSLRLTGRRRMLRSIEAIADAFLVPMRAAQPRGPYLVGGGCEGSLIAFEIARRLVEAGERVDCLMTWGTPAPGPAMDVVFAGSSLRRLWWQFQSVMSKGSLRELGWRGYLPLVGHEMVEHSLFSAMLRYRPDGTIPLPMDLVVLEPMSGERRIDDSTMGWSAYVGGGVRVHRLPGNHDTWLKDHVEAFGRFLATSLSDSDETDERRSAVRLSASSAA